MKNILSRLGIMGELLSFLWKQKMWFLIPAVVVMLVFVVIIVVSGPAAPFIYTLF